MFSGFEDAVRSGDFGRFFFFFVIFDVELTPFSFRLPPPAEAYSSPGMLWGVKVDEGNSTTEVGLGPKSEEALARVLKIALPFSSYSQLLPQMSKVHEDVSFRQRDGKGCQTGD